LYFQNDDARLNKVCSIMGLDFDIVKKQLAYGKQPYIAYTNKEIKNELEAVGMDGISVVYSFARFDQESVARHVIGYLSRKDQIGQNGIEKFYEDVLKENVQSSIGFVADAGKNLVKGLGYRINKGNSVDKDVVLTLDYHIQKIVEDVMEKNNIKGAVVVEDVNTGDIAAIASKPDFDQNNVENYLQSEDNALYNRAVAAYNLGSVFKIVDAAALLEAPDIAQENYDCLGYIRLGSLEFKCSSYGEGGHGIVDLTQAFAKSCNPYFINIGQKIGYPRLISMAQKFGLGSATGIKEQGIGEASGKLPSLGTYYSSGDIANFSIGQGVMMATPLQVADIVATIANGGIKNRVNIVDFIMDHDGNKLRDVRVKEGHRIISKETAEKVKSLMEAVTDYGTGTTARLEEFGGAAGKTGSAETGNKDIVHAWFAGYFPRIEPRYAISVLVENGQYGGKVAAPIFAEIAQEIIKKGL